MVCVCVMRWGVKEKFIWLDFVERVGKRKTRQSFAGSAKRKIREFTLENDDENNLKFIRLGDVHKWRHGSSDRLLKESHKGQELIYDVIYRCTLTFKVINMRHCEFGIINFFDIIRYKIDFKSQLFMFTSTKLLRNKLNAEFQSLVIHSKD